MFAALRSFNLTDCNQGGVCRALVMKNQLVRLKPRLVMSN